jgi:hypothetical protein
MSPQMQNKTEQLCVFENKLTKNQKNIPPLLLSDFMQLEREPKILFSTKTLTSLLKTSLRCIGLLLKRKSLDSKQSEI